MAGGLHGWDSHAEEEEQTESLGLGEAEVLSRAQLSCFRKVTWRKEKPSSLCP